MKPGVYFNPDTLEMCIFEMDNAFKALCIYWFKNGKRVQIMHNRRLLSFGTPKYIIPNFKYLGAV